MFGFNIQIYELKLLKPVTCRLILLDNVTCVDVQPTHIYKLKPEHLYIGYPCAPKSLV